MRHARGIVGWTALALAGLGTAVAMAGSGRVDWHAFSSSGAVATRSSAHRVICSVGQMAAGKGAAGRYQMGLGFWYGTPKTACPVIRTGDINAGGTITSADIILLINYVFRSGPPPRPCAASGDVNCSGAITSSDIIHLVNHVFKSGSAPCNVCNLVGAGVWICS